jgi:hypothetical protein
MGSLLSAEHVITSAHCSTQTVQPTLLTTTAAMVDIEAERGRIGFGLK